MVVGREAGTFVAEEIGNYQFFIKLNTKRHTTQLPTSGYLLRVRNMYTSFHSCIFYKHQNVETAIQQQASKRNAVRLYFRILVSHEEEHSTALYHSGDVPKHYAVWKNLHGNLLTLWTIRRPAPICACHE